MCETLKDRLKGMGGEIDQTLDQAVEAFDSIERGILESVGCCMPCGTCVELCPEKEVPDDFQDNGHCPCQTNGF